MFEFKFLQNILHTKNEDGKEVFDFEALCRNYGIKNARNVYMKVPQKYKAKGTLSGRYRNGITRRGAIWFALKHNEAFLQWAADTVIYDYNPKKKDNE